MRDNLHVILCFSPIGDPIKVRTRRFPALVNCVVIDWFQPWPEEALTSVSKRFLGEVELGEAWAKDNIMNVSSWASACTRPAGCFLCCSCLRHFHFLWRCH